MYPKLKFHIITFKNELQIFKDFLSPKKLNHFKKRFLDKYPKLGESNINLISFLKRKTKQKREIFLRNLKRYPKEWNLIEKRFHKTLTIVLNTSWSKKPKCCNADLSLAVVFPRHLDTYYFVVPGESDIDYVMKICAHEITHFLYFKKFGELFPHIPKEYYGGNHVEWVLSEILVSIILNDRRFENIFAEEHFSYSLFYNNKIGSKTIMQIFEDKYKQMVEKDKKLFDDYLKWAYDYAKTHEKQLMVVK